jgi:hypothetical protein
MQYGERGFLKVQVGLEFLEFSRTIDAIVGGEGGIRFHGAGDSTLVTVRIHGKGWMRDRGKTNESKKQETGRDSYLEKKDMVITEGKWLKLLE